MAKYTTLVRTICEENAGLNESAGFNNVDSVLNNSWDEIFTTQCTFFDDTYRSILCKKILKHYYMREIGAETVGLWKLWMNTKLEEIMPYYNQLYESALIDFDPMNNMSLTKSRNVVGNETGSTQKYGTSNDTETGSKNRTISETGSSSTEGEASNSGRTSHDENNTKDTTEMRSKADAYSDTPQSTLYNVNQLAYLTDYRKIGESNTDAIHDVIDTEGTNSSSGSYEDTTNTTNSKTDNTSTTTTNQHTNADTKNTTLNTTEQYIENVIGNNGSWNYSRLLQDYRETFLNIDMLVVNEFKDLFMKLW